jgi:hypothetical protein
MIKQEMHMKFWWGDTWQNDNLQYTVGDGTIALAMESLKQLTGSGSRWFVTGLGAPTSVRRSNWLQNPRLAFLLYGPSEFQISQKSHKENYIQADRFHRFSSTIGKGTDKSLAFPISYFPICSTKKKQFSFNVLNKLEQRSHKCVELRRSI